MYSCDSLIMTRLGSNMSEFYSRYPGQLTTSIYSSWFSSVQKCGGINQRWIWHKGMIQWFAFLETLIHKTLKRAELAHITTSLIHTVTASLCYASTPFPVFLTGLNQWPLHWAFCLKINDISRIKTLECCSICVSRILTTDASSNLVGTRITFAKQKQVCGDRIGMIDVTTVSWNSKVHWVLNPLMIRTDLACVTSWSRVPIRFGEIGS